jgi:hypothetical protein
MFYADQVGLREVARALKVMADAPGADRASWTPAALLTRLADEGRQFSGYKGPSK